MAVLGLACGAVALAQGIESPGLYVGRKYWYEPAHEKYSPLEFHRVPDFDRGMFTVPRKSKFEVLEVSRGWLKLRFESSAYASESTAYLHARILRSRLYAPTVGESVQDTFRRSVIFEEDPAVIGRRLNALDSPAEKSGVPPPWVIRQRSIKLPPPPPQ